MPTNPRPLIMTEHHPEMSDQEIFQNKVLRPLLKMKNPELISVVHYFILKEHWPTHHMTNDQKLTYVQNQLSKHKILKSMMMGMILGNMDPDEIKFFLENYEESKKRFTALLAQRIAGQI
jgi:hypothetical protein